MWDSQSTDMCKSIRTSEESLPTEWGREGVKVCAYEPQGGRMRYKGRE